jgi:hypothetical protein
VFDPWDFASLLLKILSAGAAITGVALPLMDAARAESVQVVSRAGSSAGSYPQALK